MVKGVISKVAACFMMVCFLAVSSAYAGQATITAPANGASLAAPAVFTIAPNGQSEGWLYFGNGLGKYNYYSASIDNATTVTVPGLPNDNSTVYVRMWSRNGAVWTYNDYSFIGNNTFAYDGAEMTTPAANGATLAKTFTFEWESVAGATKYWLDIGTGAPGATNLYTAGYTSTSARINNLPTTANTVIYVRLATRCGGFMTYKDYTYNAQSLSGMTTPANSGATLAKPAQFEWSDVGADGYWLYIGSSVGGYQYYSTNMGTALSATVPGLPYNGSAVYVRLWTRRGATWAFNDYSYVANNSGSTDLAQITSPVVTDNITDNATSFVWDNATKVGATNFWLDIGTTSGAYDIASFNMKLNNTKSYTIPALYNNSTIYVTLWTRIGNFTNKLIYAFKTRF